MSLLAAAALAGCQTLGGGTPMEGPVALNAAKCSGFYSVTSRDIKSAELFEVAKFRAARDGVALVSLTPAFNDGSATALTGSGDAYDALAAGCTTLYDDRYEIVNEGAPG
jgi:hypothetical protein